MAWVKLHDGYYENPKVVGVGLVAEALWIRAIAYSNRNELDGALPCHVWRLIGAHAEQHPRTLTRAVQRLIEAGLVERTETGYLLHDYLDYQPTKAENAQRRAQTRERVAKWRAEHPASENGQRNAVSNVDVTALQEPW